MQYEPVIGLEVHAELNTRTKMYCACENSFGGVPNTRICPVCTGMPGTLPTLNRDAVISAIRAGLAMGCRINRCTQLYRKHYYYPDLPKGYQISQYKIPLCEEGSFQYYSGEEIKTAAIRQIHVEEDAGKLLHLEDHTLIDYNRCGVPLIEIVTQPCFHSKEDARAFLDAVRTMLLFLGISDCRMQEGALRCDVNVSLRPAGVTHLSPRVEMKNINTFSGAERAIEYEISRQNKIFSEGESPCQETRRWDDEKGCSFTLRSKENAQDYRFLPEPDIPMILTEDDFIEKLQESIPESEVSRRLRYEEKCNLNAYDASQIARNFDYSAFYDECIALGADGKACANWLFGEISKLVNESGLSLSASKLTAHALCDVLSAVQSGIINGSSAKQVVGVLFESGGEFNDILDQLGLRQIVDKDTLITIIEEVICENERAVFDYKRGKTNVLGYLTGQCMRKSKGRGNPQQFSKLLHSKLNA